jgi:ferrochelatase
MSIPIKTPITGVILMTYGSATTSKDVESFLRHVYPEPEEELISEFKRRFDIVGSSPLVDVTIKQAEALELTLNATNPDLHYLVRAGMLHSGPFITEAMSELKSLGATRVLGLLMSPQYSPHIMGGYNQAFEQAAVQNGYNAGQASILGWWGTQPKFVELLGNRIRRTKQELEQKYQQTIPVIFTTHSLPERVVQKDPNYLKQLSATSMAVVANAQLQPGQWYTAYQSAGHTPEPWLKPDLTDVIADLKQTQTAAVLIVPIQFLADHLEILYDLDTAAREQTEEMGVHYYRLPVPGVDPLFIEALSDIVLSGNE